MEEERRNEKYLEENRSKTLEETFSPLLEQKEKNFVVKRRKFLPNFFVCFSFLFWKNNKRKKEKKKIQKTQKGKRKSKEFIIRGKTYKMREIFCKKSFTFYNDMSVANLMKMIFFGDFEKSEKKKDDVFLCHWKKREIELCYI